MKYFLALLAAAGLAIASQGCCRNCPPPGPRPDERKTLTILFEGLISYVQDADGDGVTVLLVDSRNAAGGIPAHVPLVTFDSSDGAVQNDVPWVLDREDVEIVLEPPPATASLQVDPNVWAWTGSMSQLTGGLSAIKPEFLDMTTVPGNAAVARIRLEHGKLEVDPRPEAILNTPVTFRTALGTLHPGGYSTPKAALLLKYSVTVPAATQITLKSHLIGKRHLNTPKRTFAPTALSLRATVGNISAQAHGSAGVDHDFAKLYDLVSPTPVNLFLPNFPPPPGVGTRVCMGGGG